MTDTVLTRRPLLVRLGKIEGQVRGIAGMVDDGRDCIDILTQLIAADQALRSVAVALLEEHVAQCMVVAGDADDARKDATLRETSDAIARLVRH